MPKLKLEFQADLGVKQSFTDLSSMTKLMPFADARAIAFGWGCDTGAYLGSEQYWFAEITRDGVTRRKLPAALIERYNKLPERAYSSNKAATLLRAFKFAEGAGVMLGTDQVALFADIQAEPQIIAIENGFLTMSGPQYSSSKKDSFYFPEYCGNPAGNLLPVVLSAPEDSKGDGRHVGLLEIDAAAGKARWLHTQADGGPRATQLDEYKDFLMDDGPLAGMGLALSRGRPPVLYDCAWIADHWHLYAAGFQGNHNRYGISPAVLTRNRPDVSLDKALFQPREQSFGRICASHDRLIVTPLRSNGPNKGKQTVYLYGDGQEHALGLPKGYAKHFVAEYCAGSYWVLPTHLGGANDAVAVCSGE